MPRFRTKVRMVEAVHYVGNPDDVQGFVQEDGKKVGADYKIKTAEGAVTVPDNSWIVRENGVLEVYPIEHFERMFEVVEGG